MNTVRPGFILPSSAFTLSVKQIRHYSHLDKPPRVGDVIYGKVVYVGEHSSLENKEGRIHLINDGSRAVFVYGNRYAPDYYEGLIPTHNPPNVDLLARSGVVGVMTEKNAAVKDPTKIQVLGYVVDADGKRLNTTDYPVAMAKSPLDENKKRAKMVLHIGTSMNAGKSTSAIACCWALSAMGHKVRASKVTGTASLKDILHMQDSGAESISDFTYLGYPSTYMLSEDEVISIFKNLDSKFASNSSKYWVVEFADGILQRETAMLLRNPYVRSRIHRLIFSASDAFGALGGLRLLREEFDLVPAALSGRCTSSPLTIQELKGRASVEVFNNVLRDLKHLSQILI